MDDPARGTIATHVRGRDGGCRLGSGRLSPTDDGDFLSALPVRSASGYRRLVAEVSGKRGLHIRSSHQGQVHRTAVAYRQDPLALAVVEWAFESDGAREAIRWVHPGHFAVLDDGMGALQRKALASCVETHGHHGAGSEPGRDQLIRPRRKQKPGLSRIPPVSAGEGYRLPRRAGQRTRASGMVAPGRLGHPPRIRACGPP